MFSHVAHGCCCLLLAGATREKGSTSSVRVIAYALLDAHTMVRTINCINLTTWGGHAYIMDISKIFLLVPLVPMEEMARRLSPFPQVPPGLKGSTNPLSQVKVQSCLRRDLNTDQQAQCYSRKRPARLAAESALPVT